MKSILEYILQNEGITNTRLATILDVAPASITHIMSGRNKPSYDFLVKLVEAFPQYDARWVLTGKGEPLSTPPTQQCVDGELQLFGSAFTTQKETDTVGAILETRTAELKNTTTPVAASGKTRLIVCFPDRTFVEYESK